MKMKFTMDVFRVAGQKTEQFKDDKNFQKASQRLAKKTADELEKYFLKANMEVDISYDIEY